MIREKCNKIKATSREVRYSYFAKQKSKGKATPYTVNIKIKIIACMPYFVYILKCSDGTLYTGITNDIEQRIVAHNTSKNGAKYTASRRPVTLQYSETYETKSLALKREAQIKKFTREKKLILISK